MDPARAGSARAHVPRSKQGTRPPWRVESPTPESTAQAGSGADRRGRGHDGSRREGRGRPPWRALRKRKFGESRKDLVRIIGPAAPKAERYRSRIVTVMPLALQINAHRADRCRRVKPALRICRPTSVAARPSVRCLVVCSILARSGRTSPRFHCQLDKHRKDGVFQYRDMIKPTLQMTRVANCLPNEEGPGRWPASWETCG